MKISLSNNVLLKYSLLIILILMISMQMKYINGIGGKFYYLIFVFYGFIFLVLSFATKNLKPFSQQIAKPFIFMMIITITYLIIFDRSSSGVFYTFARLVISSIILYSIYYYKNYYNSKFFEHLQFIFIFILILCILSPEYANGRFAGIFQNSNTTGFFASIGFGLILFGKKIKYKNLFLILFIVIVLMSASRSALVCLSLAIFLYIGLNIKKLAIASILLLLLFGVNIYMEKTYNITTGLSRFQTTSKNNDLLYGRESEFENGINTIKQKPITGHGLDKYAYISKDAVVGFVDPGYAFNPHNSYIAVMIQYGLFFGSIILILIFYYVIKIIFSKKVNIIVKFLILNSLLNASVESFLFSVSGYEGLFFWFALALGLNQINYNMSKDSNAI